MELSGYPPLSEYLYNPWVDRLSIPVVIIINIGVLVMLRGYGRMKAQGGTKAQSAAFEAAGIKAVYWDDDREAAISSLRKGDGLAVRRLGDLATSKPDLRWALIGEDKRTSFKGVFARGNFIRDLELGVDLKTMPAVEAVLRATEDWAKERRTLPRRESVEHGKKGGRPRAKRTDKHTAMKAWRDLVKYPTQAAALASPEMKGWSKSAATRSIKNGGLGPRGSIPGRLPKPKA